MTSFRQKRIQVIGLTDVHCTGFDVPVAERKDLRCSLSFLFASEIAAR